MDGRHHLRPADRATFGRLTTQVYGQQQPRNQLALVLDGKVLSAPTVQQPILGGRLSIAGPFTKAEANRLADELAGHS